MVVSIIVVVMKRQGKLPLTMFINLSTYELLLFGE